MPTKIDISNLTLNPEEVSEISEAILEREFINGVLSANHEIETGIQHKKQIVFAGKIADTLKAATDCTPGEGGTLALTQKYWDPVKYDTRYTHCAAQLNNLLKIFAKAQRVNPDFYNRIDSQEMGLVAAMVGMMLRETLPIKVWFSDVAADTVANAGVLVNGTDKTLYDVFDGLWKQIFAVAALSAGGDQHVAIAKNAEATFAAQALAADDAFNTFVAMVEAADERLIADGSIKFYVTRSMADNYRATLRNKTLGAGFIEITEGGRPRLFFDGIPIEIMYVWDRHIKAIEQNGTKYNLPHRALLTTPENIPVGTLNQSDWAAIDSFYDRTLKSNIMDVAFSLDAKWLEDYMGVAAY